MWRCDEPEARIDEINRERIVCASQRRAPSNRMPARSADKTQASEDAIGAGV